MSESTKVADAINEEDLLNSIRFAVSEEEARDARPKPQQVVPAVRSKAADPLVLGAPVKRGKTSNDLKKNGNNGAAAAPLALGPVTLTPVQNDGPRRGPAPMFDDSAVRAEIDEIVREAVAHALSDAQDDHIRAVVRTELARLLDHDRDGAGIGLV